MHRIAHLGCIATIGLLFVPGITSGQPHPRQYVRVYEVRDGSNIPSGETLGQAMDRRNNVLIHFDQEELLSALQQTQANSVLIRVEANLQRGAGLAQPMEVDNFITVTETPGDSSTAKTFRFVYHVRRVDFDQCSQSLIGILPDSFINLTRLGVSAGDRLYLKITDVNSQNDLNFITDIETFGLDPQVTDSFLLLRRLGVTKELKTADFREINFRPAPGTTFGWVYRERKNPVLRVLMPGFGYNLSFTDWGDAAFDIATGKFKEGTQGSNVEIGTGFMLTLSERPNHLATLWYCNHGTW